MEIRYKTGKMLKNPPSLKLLFITSILIISSIIYEIDVIRSPSNYQIACEKFGFAHPEEQEAILNILNLAGYFKADKLREQIDQASIFRNNHQSYMKIRRALKRAGSDKDPKEFNPKAAIPALFGKPKPHLWELLDNARMTDQDAAKMILYFAQTGFGRGENQLRQVLSHISEMKKYRKEYIVAAQKIGLIDSIKPELKHYHTAIILGATRPGLYARLVEFNSYLKNITVDEISVLSGERELWAEVEGIAPDLLNALRKAKAEGSSIDNIKIIYDSKMQLAGISEGKAYLKELAQKFDIKIDNDLPMIGRNNRTYLNYDKDEMRVVTEALMSKDVILEFNFDKDCEILSTPQFKDGRIPNTDSTASHKAKEFVDKIIAGKYQNIINFDILAVSNNPYVERQQISLQKAFDKELKSRNLANKYSVTVHPAGFGCKEDIPAIHSEFGALLSELFMKAYPTIDIKPFLFQNRRH